MVIGMTEPNEQLPNNPGGAVSPLAVLLMGLVLVVLALVVYGARSSDTYRSVQSLGRMVVEAEMMAVEHDGKFTDDVDQLNKFRGGLKPALEDSRTHLQIEDAGKETLAFRLTTKKRFAATRTIEVMAKSGGKDGLIKCSYSSRCPSWSDWAEP